MPKESEVMNLKIIILHLTLIFSFTSRAHAQSCRYFLGNHISGENLIQHYTFILFNSLNKALRSIKTDESCNLLALKLADALKSVPVYKGKVYRGLVKTKELSRVRPGDCYFDSAFMSATRSKKTARRFDKGALLKIDSLTGKSISKISFYPWEKEVLFVPYTPLKLISVRQKIWSKGDVFSFKEVTLKDCPNPPSSP
jgi:hypothetical protein